MAVEKRVVAALAALNSAEATDESSESAKGKGADSESPAVVATPKQRWKFEKLHGLGDVIKLSDGKEFTFRLIPLNDGSGFSPVSSVVTEDEKFAADLREAAKNKALGIYEVPNFK